MFRTCSLGSDQMSTSTKHMSSSPSELSITNLASLGIYRSCVQSPRGVREALNRTRCRYFASLRISPHPKRPTPIKVVKHPGCTPPGFLWCDVLENCEDEGEGAASRAKANQEREVNLRLRYFSDVYGESGT